MATKDKKVQIILQFLNPFECFEEVAQALRGLDYPVECLLSWMHESEFKDANNQYYTERARYNEREKVTRFNSFLTLADKGEHDHVRGYSTLKQLWSQAGYDDFKLEDLADDLDDDDVEFHSGLDQGNYSYTPKISKTKFYEYERIDPKPISIAQERYENQFRVFMKTLFRKGESAYFSMDCFGGITVPVDDAISKGEGPLFINLNPCTDNGIVNVTSFRHYLLEIDEDEEGNVVPLDKQYAWILASHLPVSTITYSGGKSLHATVKIEAEDLLEYRDRVDEVRDYCIKIGMPLDRRVINPDRYTRCAGGLRDGVEQYLLDINVGARDYDHWVVKRNIYLKAPVQETDDG